ncbi:hypothetical protein ACQX0Q_02645 [Corynebacterium diphtheriae]
MTQYGRKNYSDVAPKDNVSACSGNFETMNLLENAEARRVRTLHALDSDSQATRGQFFTPLLAARIIASLPNLPESGVFTILDPGAGSGILTAAIADRIHRLRPKLKMEITGSSGFGVRSGVKKTTVGSAGHHNI